MQKGFFTSVVLSLMLTLSALAGVLSPDPRRHVIADPRSGLALFGFDPVGYHVDGRAIPGKPTFELMLQGTVWRFGSDANRAVFAADPDAYIPLFGGHDGERVAAGVLAKGDPELFLLVDGSVVFFRSQESRLKYAADDAMRQKSNDLWPDVVRQQAVH